MACKDATERRDRKFLVARRAGFTVQVIARKFRVTPKTVYNGIERARLAERPAGTPRRGPDLVLAFGSSCKALGVLRCQDVHPCRKCDCRGCVSCNWTGLAAIPKGTTLCCGVCHQSGMESHPALRRHSSDPQPDRKPPTTPLTKERKRKGRRIILAALEPSQN